MKHFTRARYLCLPNPRNIWVLLLVGIIILQFACLGLLFRKVHRIENQTPSALQAASVSHPEVSVTDNAVYIPELRLKLPLDPTSLSLVYSLRTSDITASRIDPIEADISTKDLIAYPINPNQAIGCSSAVRIKLEAKPDPYNPHEIVAASVKLADGRMLQVYAFHHDDCTLANKMSNTDPDTVADVFKEATSY